MYVTTLCKYTYQNSALHTCTCIHDVIGDVERKEERKKERHLRQWKNENESCHVHVHVHVCTCVLIKQIFGFSI